MTSVIPLFIPAAGPIKRATIKAVETMTEEFFDVLD
jgi:hypothetical protein